MTSPGWIQIGVFVALVALGVKPLGSYLFRVFESETRPLPRFLGPIERLLFRLGGVDPRKEQRWQDYASALLVFSGVSLGVTYALQRVQHLLPLNPRHAPTVPPDLAFNTAVSFVTNTNWQSYAGESAMSDLTQMLGLAWNNFTSAAVGLGVALALARGLTRRVTGPGSEPRTTLGNFWADLLRAILYVLLPLSLVAALFLASQGVVQTLSGDHLAITLEGRPQRVVRGPVASQEAIKQLGTNGGGFFNANSAHPFENPTPLTNLFELVLIFAIPAALTHTYGKMAGDVRQGRVLLGAMALLFGFLVLATYAAESRPNPALAGLPIAEGLGNLEGKEVRFGVAGSALFATVTTAASCGAVNAMHDSFTPLGGLVPLLDIQLGEVVLGGVGAGLYGMLIFVVLTVFIAGLMVGRTPEYLGKKIEAREMKLAVLYVLVFPMVVLGLTAWAAVVPAGTAALGNRGPHGFTEILYAFSSATGNNGSAFAGLNASSPFWNITLAVAMLAGRFLMILPVLALGGSMVQKRTVAPGPGTFPTDGLLFTGLLAAIVVVVGALTFFPALSLGPVVEHFLASRGRVF